MQQGRTAGKRPVLKSMTDYLESGYKAPRAIALMLSKNANITVAEIVEQTALTKCTIHTVIKGMRGLKLIYVSAWEKTAGNGRAPRYSVGNERDVRRPKPKRSATYAEQVKRVAVKALKDAMDREARAKHFKEIAAHFVPIRDEAQQYEVNRQYLNHISGGAYG